MHPTVRAGVLRRASVPVLLSLAAACAPDLTAAAVVPDLATSTTPAPAADRPASTTLAWHEVARALIVKNAPNQQAALRAIAYLAVAQDSAAASARRAARALHGRPRPSERGAIAAASAMVLGDVFPADSAAVHARRRAEHDAAIEAGEARDARDAGEALGLAVGAALAARAHADGFDHAGDPVEVPVGPGRWRSSLVPARAPLLPWLGRARPFYLAAGSAVRPAPPPAVGSAAFASAMAEVRAYADHRTPEQQAIAERWAMTTGSLVAGYWDETAQRLVERARLDEGAAAHALALALGAAWDANIACHDAKYTYWLWRPSQADTAIRTAVALPNHPSYPSNHACISGTAAAVLGALFPRERRALRAQAEEAALSRVYGGLHYRFDGDAGLALGRRVAAEALARR